MSMPAPHEDERGEKPSGHSSVPPVSLSRQLSAEMMTAIEDAIDSKLYKADEVYELIVSMGSFGELIKSKHPLAKSLLKICAEYYEEMGPAVAEAFSFLKFDLFRKKKQAEANSVLGRLMHKKAS